MVATQWGNILAHGQGQDRGVFTVDLDDGTSIVWENKSNGKKLEIPNESIWEVKWRSIPGRCKLTLKLDAGAIALFTGFKNKDKEVLGKYFDSKCAGKEIEENQLATTGLNLGTIEVANNELTVLARDGKSEVMSVNLSHVKNCAVPVNNEVEIQCETDDLRGDEECVDMIRFFVPPDVDGVANAEELCDDLKAVTNATTGEVIFEFDSRVGSFLTPRGKYAIEMYKDYLRLHGTTYDFNIEYENIQKIYLVPDPKSPSRFLVMCLKTGLQQGRQIYPQLVLKLKEEVQLVQSFMTQAELDEEYGTRYIEEDKRHEPNILERSEDEIYKIVAKCFHFVAKVKIFKTSDYESSQGFKAVSCAVGNADGLVYPLTKSLMYLHKPVIMIPYKSMHEVWFLRLDDKNLLHTFDLEVVWVDAKGYKTTTTFKNIVKKESMNLREFLRKKKVNIKMKRGDGPEMVSSSIIDEQLGEESDENSEDDEAYTEADADAAEAAESSVDSDDGEYDENASSSEDEKPKKKRSKRSKKHKKKSKKR